MVSIAIPSRNEKFLNNTIRDILEKATGDIEIFPILDGYEPDELVIDRRVKYIRLPKVDYTQKRHGINEMVRICSGEYVMSVDGHCMFAKGFDEQLVSDHQPNWVQIPRRHRLDAENWCLQEQPDGRPPIDYEYTMWPLKVKDKPGLHGFKWDARTKDRMDIKIDETMHFQGSCWFMTKDWFNKIGLMQIDGYSGWGQEAEEILYKTYRAGGKVMTNKNTWYAHLHKGQKYGRMYFMSRDSVNQCNAYSWKYWAYEDKETFKNIIKRFWPIPGWPEDWEKRIWEEKNSETPNQ